MNVARIASALAVAGLLAGGGAAYLARPASDAAASRAPTITPAMASPSAAPAEPLLARGGQPAQAAQAARQAQQAGAAKQGTAQGSGPAGPIAAKPAVARASATQSARFTAWANHGGRALLLNSLGILSKAKSDAAVKNIAALETDSGTLIADGNACLADPPPDYAASWNAAFAAMVLAGDDLAARNLTGARAESHIVETEIYLFTSQAS
jgi:sulfur transfer complex TusBCD TusB component (DsrH family)